MTFEIIMAGTNEIALYASNEILVSDEHDALDLIVNTPASWIVLHAHNFTDDFFDLSTRKLGRFFRSAQTIVCGSQ